MTIECYFEGDSSRRVFPISSPEAQTIVEDLGAAFSWFKVDECLSISEPTHHPCLDAEVVTTFLPLLMGRTLFGEMCGVVARKFCLAQKTSFLRAYMLWPRSEMAAFLPTSCVPLARGVNHVEYGRPAPNNIGEFFDCYFRGDPSTVESHFNLPERRGRYETFYGVTVSSGTGEVLRTKQYVYDEQGALSDWDVVYMIYSKKSEFLTNATG